MAKRSAGAIGGTGIGIGTRKAAFRHLRSLSSSESVGEPQGEAKQGEDAGQEQKFSHVSGVKFSKE